MDSRPLRQYSTGNEAHDDPGRREGRGRRYGLRQRTARSSRQTVLSSAADGPPFKADGTLFSSGRPALQGRRYSLRQRTSRPSRQTVLSSVADVPLFKADGTLYDCSRYSLWQRTARSSRQTVRSTTAAGTLFGSGRPARRDIQYALRLVTEAEGTLFDCRRCVLL